MRPINEGTARKQELPSKNTKTRSGNADALRITAKQNYKNKPLSKKSANSPRASKTQQSRKFRQLIAVIQKIFRE
jgi:hypothetical protein